MIVLVTLLSVAGILVTTAMLAVGLRLMGRNGLTGTSVRYGIVSGVAAVGAAAMYLVWINVGGVVNFALANVLIVLGPVMLPLSFQALHRSAVGRWCSIVSLSSLVVVGATSLLLTPDTAQWARVGALALVCACAALAALTSPEARRVPIRILAAAVGGYAVYCAMRLVTLVVEGGSPHGLFSDGGAIAVGVVTVLLAGGSVVWFWVASRSDARRAPFPAASVLVVREESRWPHLADILPRFPELVRELRDAAVTVDPRAFPVDDGVALSASGVAPLLLRRLREEYHWSDEELALVSASSSS